MMTKVCWDSQTLACPCGYALQLLFYKISLKLNHTGPRAQGALQLLFDKVFTKMHG